MKEIPRENTFRSIYFFSKEGYNFIGNRCRENQSDLFVVGEPFKKIICTTGAEAARLFYATDEFERKNALPKRIQKTLTGRKAIQSQDDLIHQGRKQLFMQLMTAENIEKLRVLFQENWLKAAEAWEAKGSIKLFEEIPLVLFRSICSWTGIPFKEEEVWNKAHDLIAMVDGFGAIGARHRRGRQARDRSEIWMKDIVRQVRAGVLTPSKNSALHFFSNFKEANGRPLNDLLTGIELLNLIRPTVAISYYITFGAVALTQHTHDAQKIKNGDDEFTERFANEIRRYYPIGPFVGAKVKKGFQWKGYFLPKGALMLLDIYGTNHDERYWEKPHEFWPDNFLHWSKSPFDFIPQGGGEYLENHRCAGEWITVELVKESLRQLTRHMDYEVPVQDLTYSLTRIPTYPKSGVILTNVISQASLAQWKV